jgi:hypothetical protein
MEFGNSTMSVIQFIYYPDRRARIQPLLPTLSFASPIGNAWSYARYIKLLFAKEIVSARAGFEHRFRRMAAVVLRGERKALQ